MHTNTEGSTPLPDGVLRHLRTALDARRVITERDRLLPYESDALATERGAPRAALFPRSEDEIAAVLSVLHGAGIPFVPRGSGTGLSGGAVARDAVLVCTNRMNRILEIEAEGRRATVEPGAVTDEVSRAAAPHGLRYLPDPASGSVSTIGGNVAENAGGPHCLKHGVTTDHVTGLRVVLPDGRRIGLDRGESGGLDLGGLVVGSEGTLGVVSRIEVRLVPRPEAVRTALGMFDEIADAGRAVTEILATGIVPVAMELVDGATIRVVERSRFAAGLPTDVGAALLVETEGFRAGAEAEIRGAADVLRSCGARSVEIATDEDDRVRLWHARKKAYGALGRLAPDIFVQDAAVPRSTLPELLPRIEEIAARHGVRLANFFHAGDGNLHPNLIFDRRDPEQLARVEAAGAEIMELCVEAGGTITGEHGVGLDKKGYMGMIYGPEELAAFRRIRDAFDPAGLCNPGKVLPDAGGEDAGGEEVGGEGVGGEGVGGSGARGGQAPGRRTRGGEARGGEARAGEPGRKEGPDGTTGAGAADPPGSGEGKIRHRAEDLVLTATGDSAVADVVRAARDHGQWLPPAEGRAGLTVEELVGRAPAGPYTAAYGGLARHLLACRVESPDGRLYRWGRAVVKNVAGYDLPRLVAGHGGRMGRLREATFRLWPRPAARRLVRLEPGLEALAALATAAPGRDVRPDGSLWSAGGGSSGPAGLRLELAGPPAGVEERAERLARWAAERGLDVMPVDSPERGGEGRPGLLPARDRTGAARAVLRARTGDPYLAGAARRVNRWRREAAALPVAVEAFPGTGILRVAPGGSGDGTSSGGGEGAGLLEAADALISLLPEAPWRLEHGPEAVARRLRERRDDAVVELEEAVVEALGGTAGRAPGGTAGSPSDPREEVT